MNESEIRDLVRKMLATELASRSIPDHEARGQLRDLRQMLQSHERLHVEIAKHIDLRTSHADEQRDRIEQKLDSFIAEAEKKETRQIIALIGVLISALAFFLIPFFMRGVDG